MPPITSACAICACPVPRTGPIALCGTCLTNPPRYSALTALYAYTPPIPKLVAGFKFRKDLSWAKYFGTQLAGQILVRGNSLPQCLIPVPLHPQRQRERGFNQALELARPLSTLLGVPIDARACRRVRATPEQTKLKARERRSNLHNAFAVTQWRGYRHVAVIDDVVTTGATVDALTQALHSVGVENVEVWAIARAS